ncbi:UNVERIFIED_CONTAM: hypothetical protein K2H54_077607, partial [Gekko kuhli]
YLPWENGAGGACPGRSCPRKLGEVTAVSTTGCGQLPEKRPEAVPASATEPNARLRSAGL